MIVIKQASGELRWVAFSSNAYRDLDGEIVSQAALEADCERADKEGDYGPLLWWHVDGLVLGHCDFNMMVGPVLVESGTFISKEVGEAIARAADDLQLSIGFKYPLGSRDVDGVFRDIKREERSLLPAGKAANPLTSVVVKEGEMKEKWSVLRALLGGDEEALQKVEAQAKATQGLADALGIERKESGDGTEGAEQPEPTTDAEVIATAVAQAITPILEEQTKALSVLTEAFVEARTKEASALTSLAQAQEALTKQLQALKAKNEEQAAKIKQLVGEQPRAFGRGYRASQAEETIASEEAAKQAGAPREQPFINTFISNFTASVQEG